MDTFCLVTCDLDLYFVVDAGTRCEKYVISKGSLSVNAQFSRVEKFMIHFYLRHL